MVAILCGHIALLPLHILFQKGLLCVKLKMLKERLCRWKNKWIYRPFTLSKVCVLTVKSLVALFSATCASCSSLNC